MLCENVGTNIVWFNGYDGFAYAMPCGWWLFDLIEKSNGVSFSVVALGNVATHHAK